MITRMFNHARMVTQQYDDNGAIEYPIACSIDEGGTIVLEQEDRHICITHNSIDDVIKVLREYKKIGDAQ